MKTLLLFLLATISFFDSFSQTAISGKFTDADNKVVISYWQDFTFHMDTVALNRQGEFKRMYNFSSPTNVKIGRTNAYLSTPFFLLYPNESLHITKPGNTFQLEGTAAIYNTFILSLINEMTALFPQSQDYNVMAKYALDKSDVFFSTFTHPNATEIRKFNDATLINRVKFGSVLVRYSDNPKTLNDLQNLFQAAESKNAPDNDAITKYLDKMDLSSPLVHTDVPILNNLNNFIRMCRLQLIKKDSFLSEADSYVLENKLIKTIFARSKVKTALLAYNLHHRINYYTEYPTQLTSVEDYIREFAIEPDAGQYIPVINNILLKKKLTIGILAKGSAAPGFKLPDINGQQVSLSDYKNKVIYLDLWASWCSPCLKEMPYLNALKEKYKGTDFQAISISIDTDKEKWLQKIKALNLTGVQLIDNMGSIKSKTATSYNVVAVPVFVLIDKKGKIYSANAPRPSEPDLLEPEINQLLKAQ